MAKTKALPAKQRESLLATLRSRFDANMTRHRGVEWRTVQARLESNGDKLASLNELETTGGEPDLIAIDKSGACVFVDCSAQSPRGRRSVCYDGDARESRKEHKPKDSAQEMAARWGVELLTEDEYRMLQKLGEFDTTTSSWIRTPDDIRELGGALFCDRRYDTVFVYHNGAESYYAGRGFRCVIRI